MNNKALMIGINKLSEILRGLLVIKSMIINDMEKIIAQINPTKKKQYYRYNLITNNTKLYCTNIHMYYM